jgi:hypothetical protein
MHPTRHVRVDGSHTGAAMPQSSFDEHWTQACSRRSQRGKEPPHWASDVHATHCRVVGSHAPAQSALLAHATHVPFATSQIGSVAGQDSPPLHAGWHAWSLGQHVFPLGQSCAAASPLTWDAHATHFPSTHLGEERGQSSSLTQATQPSDALHRSNGPQSSRPLTPQSAPVPVAASARSSDSFAASCTCASQAPSRGATSLGASLDASLEASSARGIGASCQHAARKEQVMKRRAHVRMRGPSALDVPR